MLACMCPYARTHVSIYLVVCVLMCDRMCPYAPLHVPLCFVRMSNLDSSRIDGNLLFKEIHYVDGGVRVSVTRIKGGDGVPILVTPYA